jgi:molybdate/tungstate transport system substrate-binding protein
LKGTVPARTTTGRRWCGGVIAAAALLTTIGRAAVLPPSTDELAVCHAGSVQSAFREVEHAFSAAHPQVTVHDVSGGSVALAGRMAAGLQSCDVFAAADYVDVDLLLKPLGLADYTIVFAKGRMVLAYLATDPLTRGIATPGDFNPPASIPRAAADWYRILLGPGVRVAGSHPFLDPAGYRSHMIFQLAQTYYRVPNLHNSLLERYTILPAVGGADAAQGRTLGIDYNFQFSYEHSAAATAKNNPAYRYVALPDRIDLSTASYNSDYAKATVTIPGIGGSATQVSIPATRVAWGLSIPNRRRNLENAIAFVNLLLEAGGTAALTRYGPTPISRALVSTADYARLPKSLQPLVKAGDVRP